MTSRASRPPAKHWPDRAEVVAGMDLTAGGSWLGVNDYGLVAAILNRRGTLGPAQGKRSRGELVLEALDHAEADIAAGAIANIDPDAYRPFNLVVADRGQAFWIRCTEDGRVEKSSIGEGLSMLTAGELNDPTSARIRRYRPLFKGVSPPEPPDWSNWRLLAASTASDSGDPVDAMCIHSGGDYGTCSSSLIALPKEPNRPIEWHFAPGPPDTHDYTPVAI